MLKLLHNALRRGRSLLPVQGFAFGRPIVVLQSDDWGRVGVRNRQCWDELRDQGLNLGERSYDSYSLETAEDVGAIVSLLQRHRDSAGRCPSLGVNFVLANLDFTKAIANNFRRIDLRTLPEGFPDGWERPGLFEAYREGISSGTLSPALHGATHFCRQAVERQLNDPGERGLLLRKLWKAGVPYIHWRMPWIGFEYWDPEAAEGGFLTSTVQEGLIGSAVNIFAELFSKRPSSACAPGYRADETTHRAWAKYGIRVAQNGPGKPTPPHFDENGMLHLYRAMDFEPALTGEFSLNACVQAAEDCIARGLPVVVSVHSINFHSAIQDFRSRTLRLLNEFLAVLEAKHSDLLYLRNEDLYDLVDKGTVQSTQSTLRIPVTMRKFAPGRTAAGWSA